jgi:hypothetical protein
MMKKYFDIITLTVTFYNVPALKLNYTFKLEWFYTNIYCIYFAFVFSLIVVLLAHTKKMEMDA